MEIALFPLTTVLFPQGVLPLRVFEARYMDMVRDCMRNDMPFGVLMMTDPQASDVTPTTATAEVGTLARITAWEMKQLGVLQIRTVGAERFRLLSSQLQDNGLLIGATELLEDDDDAPVPEEFRACADLLTRIIEDLSAQLAEKRRTGQDDGTVLAQLPFEQPFKMDSCAWVSNRLCEVLPVPLKAKQKLMELTDGATRLKIVHTYLKQHSVLK